MTCLRTVSVVVLNDLDPPFGGAELVFEDFSRSCTPSRIKWPAEDHIDKSTYSRYSMGPSS